MPIITCDFESYYDKDFSLSKITTEAYIRSKDFEIIGLSIMIDEATPVWFSGTRKEVRDWLVTTLGFEGLAVGECLFLSHNAHFDMAILNWILGLRPKGYLDTLSMANALHGVNESVSLKSLAESYSLPAKGTEVLNAIGKRRADFSLDELAAYGEYCKMDTWLCRTLFDIMAPRFTKAELKAIDLTIRMYVEPVLELDEPLLKKHLVDTRDKAKKSLMALQYELQVRGLVSSGEDIKDALMSGPKFAGLLTALGADIPMKLSPITGKDTYAFAKTDEEFTAMLEHDDPVVQAAVAARLGNKSTIEESRTEAFLDICSRGGQFPFPLKYSGAAVSHRWSGFDVNVQNLPRGGVLRGAIKAPKGFKIVAADLSNIELRLGLYMAGQDDKIWDIASGVDLYMDIAAKIFNKTYEDIEALGKKSKERTTGKVVQLSSIYGTGAAKLKDTLRLVGKVKFTEQETQNMTNLYRGEYTQVTAAWNDGADVLDALYHEQDYGEYLRPGILSVTAEGILKPSGLLLTYPDLRWTKDADTGKEGYTYEQKRKSRDRVYGSKCFQRCIQSLARDIICEHMLQIDKKYQVVGTVHDEILCVVADDEVEEAKEYMLKVMRTSPSYLSGLPLDAEVGHGDNYGAAK